MNLRKSSAFLALAAITFLQVAVANAGTFKTAADKYAVVEGDIESYISFDYGDATVTVERVNDRVLMLEATVVGDSQPAQLAVAVPSLAGDPGGAEVSVKFGGKMSYLVDSKMEMQLFSPAVSDCMGFASKPTILILASTVRMLGEQFRFGTGNFGLAIEIASEVIAKFAEDCAADQNQFDILSECDAEILESDGVCVNANHADEMSSLTDDRMSLTSDWPTSSNNTLSKVGLNTGPCCLSCYDCCIKDCGDGAGNIGGSWECIWICM